MSLSIKARASGALVAGLLIQILAGACDLTSSTAPKNRKESLVPALALNVSASSAKATAASWTEIDISWTTSPSASGYQVWRATNGAGGTYTQIATVGPTVSRYADTGLLGSTEYCYEIRSFKSVGKGTTYGAFTSPLCATTLAPPVAAPSQTNAVPEGGNIRVSWQDNSANEDGFRIDMAPVTSGPWTQVTTVASNVTTVANNWQVAERQACFRVTAYNAVGPSNPSPPDCTTIPATPTGLSAKVLDAQSITVAWTDNSGVEDGYKVSRAQTGADWVDIAAVGANVVTYRDATATPNTSYTYRVVAVKDGGYSNPSNEAVAVIATSVPDAPANARAFFGDPDDYGQWILDVTWTDASSNEQGFRVEYSADTLAGWTFYNQTGPNATYVQELSSFAPPRPGCYRVIAFNNVGFSSPSNASCGDPSGFPTGLVATAVDQQTIDLTWSDNAGYESGYEIWRTTPSDSTWSIVATVPANATSYRDTQLASGQDYTYYVTVFYSTADVCCQLSSNYADAITPSPGAAPSASIQSSGPRVVPAAPNRRVPKKHRAPSPARFRRPR